MFGGACPASGQDGSFVGHLDVFEEPTVNPELLAVHRDHMPDPGRAESRRSGQFRYDPASLLHAHLARVQHEDALRSGDEDAVSAERDEEKRPPGEGRGVRARSLGADYSLYLLTGLQEPSRGLTHCVTDCHGSTSWLMGHAALAGTVVANRRPAIPAATR